MGDCDEGWPRPSGNAGTCSNHPLKREIVHHFISGCESGDMGAVQNMTEKNISEILDGINRDWNHPLRVACRNGHLDILMYLLKHGKWTYDASKRNDTLLHIAASGGQIPIVRYLLGIGHDSYINTIGNCRRTPLHCACRAGDLEMVKLLVKNGARLDAKGPGDTTPLSYACHHGHLDIVKYLRSLGASSFCGPKSNGNSPLHWACLGNEENVDLAKYLLDQGGNVNERNKAGFSPLHLAVSKRYAGIVLLLLQRGADVHAANGIGMHAIESINPYCVQDGDSYNVDTCQTLVTLLLAGSILPDVHKSYIPPLTKLLCIWAGNQDTTVVQRCMEESLKKRDVKAATFLLAAAPDVWSVNFPCENLIGYNPSLSDIEELINLLKALKCDMPTLKVCTMAVIRRQIFSKHSKYSILKEVQKLNSHLPKFIVADLTLTGCMRDMYPRLRF